ncbi:DUF1707 SHOCT-like domain-containing protein [Pseudonocardia phyllosphaerae]|uniref:DUF1707 SHOCT-like domain-containing protein n=1 Tax=Pseudonocardia phyllosphaerae TaxID=3390502 RepID=UPI0039787F62
MGDPGELRISDRDRELAAKRLHDAVGEGRITLVELEERLSAVYAARTANELRPPLADLPGGLPPTVPGGPGADPGAVPQAPVHLRTGAGSLNRGGDWTVPAALRLSSGIGSIHLDLSEVRRLPPRIDVAVSTGMGEIVLVLPAGGTADVNDVRASWGEVKTGVPGLPGGSGPHLTVHGKVGLGSLTVRPARRSWWKALLG